MMTNTHFLSYLSEFVLEWEILQPQFVKPTSRTSSGPISKRQETWPFEMGPDRNFHYSLRNGAEELSNLYFTADAWNLAKVVKKTKTHILCSITFFFEIYAVYEIMCNNMVEQHWPQMTMWPCAFHAEWLRLQTHPQSEYVTLIAFS